MVDTWNAGVVHINLADDALLVGSSFIVLAPPSMLQDPHVARKWRGTNGDTEYVIADLGSVQSVDTVSLMGLSSLIDDEELPFSALATTRVRVSAVDSSVESTLLYDSGSAAGRINPKYPKLVTLLPTPVSGRYVRVDFSEPGAEYLEAGRLVIGPREQFEFNFQAATDAKVDRSRWTDGRGGQIFIDREEDQYRVWDMSFEFITALQRFGMVEDIDLLNGRHDDILFIRDCSSSSLGRDSLWGLIEDAGPIGYGQGFVDDAHVFTKSYRIRERL